MLPEKLSEKKIIQFVLDNQKKQKYKNIGDDCAVININNNKSWLITTDTLVDRIHFLSDKIKPEDLGYKATAVNISDIASMGGTPLFITISLSIPNNIKLSWIKKLYDGINECCKEYTINIIGGDTTGSKEDIFVSITAIGEILTKNIKLRSTAKNGDLIALTGNIGDSNAGLKYILENKRYNLKRSNLKNYFINAHYRPKAYVKEGTWLSKQKDITGMLDLSDGLIKNLEDICFASNCGAEILLDKLPISEQLIKASKKQSWSPHDIALSGGEDYVLLITIDQKTYEKNNFFKKYNNKFGKLYLIGKITNDKKIKLIQDKKETNISHLSNIKLFEHF